MIGDASLVDIVGQGSGWAAAAAAVVAGDAELRSVLECVAPRHIVVTGCGSPYYLAQTTAGLLAGNTPRRAVVDAVPASELVDAASSLVPWPSDTVLVAITRSGATTELLEAIAEFRRIGGAAVVAITCRSASAVTVGADVVVGIDEGYERSIAQTRSFSSMLVAVESIVAVWGGGAPLDATGIDVEVDAALERAELLLDATGDLARFDRIDFLGSGPLHGLACEAMLKMSEMALTHSAAYHCLEYRHGPMSMVDERTLVVGLLGGTSVATERPVLDEMSALGGCTLAIEHVAGRPLAAMMPVLQLLAHRRAIARGVDPDAPRHLSAVVHLDDDLRSSRTTITSRGT